MVERLDYKLAGLGIVLLLCWLSCSPQPCRGAVIWADNFDDGDYDGWTIVVNHNVWGGAYGWSGSNWSAATTHLQMLPSIDNEGVISHPSEVASGTWSFDIQFNLTQAEVGASATFEFMSNDVSDLDHRDNNTVYFVLLEWPGDSDITIELRKWINGSGFTIGSIIPPTVPAAGWHHIDVTRTTEGLFSVYHNGALIIQGVDTDITTSEVLWLWFDTWTMIDNIVVDNAVLTPLPWAPIVIGIIVAVVVIVVVIVYFRRRRTAQ